MCTCCCNSPDSIEPSNTLIYGYLDGEGVASVTGGPVKVFSKCTLTFTFRVGKTGIQQNGAILFHVSPYWGWSAPQTDNPSLPGYVMIDADTSENVSFETSGGELPYLLIRIINGSLHHGDKLRIVYGAEPERGGGAHTDNFAESAQEFVFKTDANGDGVFKEILRQPSVEILPDVPDRLLITGPSFVSKGDTFQLTIAVLDRHDNWIRSAEGGFTIECPDFIECTTNNNRFLHSEDQHVYMIARDVGTGTITVRSDSGISGISNPITVESSRREIQLFWGDIHGHSVFSDGTGTPEDYYTYGRDAADLDFIALTDHDSWGFRPLSAIEEQYFRAGNSFSDDEHFVVILGYEWTSWDFGHRNVYFSGADACVFDSRNERYDTPDELVSALDAASSIIVPHHLGGGPVPFNLDSWSSKMMPVSEVVSVHGNSESSGCRYRIYNAGEGGFFRDALNRGYMWGAIGSSDSHDGHPGLRTNGAQVRGMVGIWADNLNRTSIFNALRNRFCYATSGARIVVEFYVSGYPMGSVISEVEPKEKVIQGKIIGENDLERIELIKNGTIYNRFYGNGNRCDFHWVDDEGESNRSAYYYLVIYQMDGEFAVSSPIWINVK